MATASVAISLFQGAEAAITKNDDLVIRRWDNSTDGFIEIDLGRATIKRIEEIQEYLGRLKIHAVTE